MDRKLLVKLSALGFIAVVSFFTFFWRYYEPPYFYWDENYHVAHAQKYLNGVFFQEPHPPLGKLLIALGEKLLKENSSNDQFINTDHAPNSPEGFSFAGYRFFPALLSWLSAVVFFLLALTVLSNTILATLAALLYTFDNGLIVHFRGAQLDGIQMFFILVTALAFALLYREPKLHKPGRLAALSALFGAGLGAVLTTKLNGLILVVLVPFLIYSLIKTRRSVLTFVVSAATSFLIIYVTVWQIHFSLAKRIMPDLPNHGYYQASPEYKELLAHNQNTSLINFPIMLRDSMAFVRHYNNGVPKLNLCKPDENGSPFYFWPIGARSISYRWERKDDLTRYIYLQVNPAVWLFSLVGVLGSAVLLIGQLFFGLAQKPKRLRWLLPFGTLYLCYMIAISRLDRVMYLYHYFIPMVVGLLLFVLLLDEVKQFGRLPIGAGFKNAAIALAISMAAACFVYFAPLTYYFPLSDQQIAERSWISLWDLRCNHCKRQNLLAVPIEERH